MLKLVIDTNLWVRVLLGGPLSSFILTAWLNNRFQVVTSIELLAELDTVWQRPRLHRHIDPQDAQELFHQLHERSLLVELVTTPPNCRDPKDNPVLATAIDGRADAIISGDSDLRADDGLRAAMLVHGVAIWGIDTLRERLSLED
jgi:uncharacterized protein